MGNIEYYKLLSVIMGVSAAVMLILTLVLWFKLNIKRDFAVLTGSEAKKDIEKIRKEAQAGTVQADLRKKRQGAAISWNTSEGLDGNGAVSLSAKLRGLSQPGGEGTVLLSQGQIDPNQTVLLGSSAGDSDATTVLGAGSSEGTTVLGADTSNGTTVLGSAPYGAPTATGAVVPGMVAASDSKKNNAAISNAGFVIEREEKT